ncbi:putative F-box protein At1g47790 isoform X2 [Helianthus annuus]|uniref:putative F-box protein At1g47790 isoform X2 n=1 Tax=Helianthus annuus TaxID=4232 RepID=UPI000B8FC64D|nr:putative F-box protein At1g47790 isoform X2 [Helianthus annuus]
MSDNVPFEIQEEIIKRLPVKSLIRFRSVSKSWKSLFDSSNFITHYRSQHQHLLVCNHRYGSEPKYVSIVDDNTFPEQRASVTLPPLVNMLNPYRTIGTSHGLFCLYNDGKLVIWNPSIRKAVGVVVPNVVDAKMFNTELGFGVCREMSDPKVVKIRYIRSFVDMESVTSIPWQVEVFTLSTGEWRSLNSNLPRKSIVFKNRLSAGGVCVDGVFYGLAIDRSTVDAQTLAYNMIISFDMTSEEFGEVNLPDRFVYHGSMWDLHLYNLRESLVLVEHSADVDNRVYSVWMMEDGVPKSFTKSYTIHLPDATINRVVEFTRSGELVIEVTKHDGESSWRVVYEPISKEISNLDILLGIDEGGFFYAHSYMETLLLLDHPSFMLFDKGILYIGSFKEECQELKAFEGYTI